MFKTLLEPKEQNNGKIPFLIASVTPFQRKFVSATIRTHNLENVGSKTCNHWSTVPTIHCTSWYQNVLNNTKAIFFQNQKCLFSRDKKIRDIRKILKWHSCDHECCKTSLAGTIFVSQETKFFQKSYLSPKPHLTLITEQVCKQMYLHSLRTKFGLKIGQKVIFVAKISSVNGQICQRY